MDAPDSSVAVRCSTSTCGDPASMYGDPEQRPHAQRQKRVSQAPHRARRALPCTSTRIGAGRADRRLWTGAGSLRDVRATRSPPRACVVLKVTVEATGTTLTDIVGVGVATAAAILGRRAMSDGSRASTTTPATPGPHRSTPAPGRSFGTGSTARATAGWIMPCTSRRSCTSGTTKAGAAYAKKLAAGKGRSGAALPGATTVRSRLPRPRRGPSARPRAAGSGSGRTLGGGYEVLRG